MTVEFSLPERWHHVDTCGRAAVLLRIAATIGAAHTAGALACFSGVPSGSSSPHVVWPPAFGELFAEQSDVAALLERQPSDAPLESDRDVAGALSDLFASQARIDRSLNLGGRPEVSDPCLSVCWALWNVVMNNWTVSDGSAKPRYWFTVSETLVVAGIKRSTLTGVDCGAAADALGLAREDWPLFSRLVADDTENGEALIDHYAEAVRLIVANETRQAGDGPARPTGFQ